MTPNEIKILKLFKMQIPFFFGLNWNQYQVPVCRALDKPQVEYHRHTKQKIRRPFKSYTKPDTAIKKTEVT